MKACSVLLLITTFTFLASADMAHSQERSTRATDAGATRQLTMKRVRMPGEPPSKRVKTLCLRTASIEILNPEGEAMRNELREQSTSPSDIERSCPDERAKIIQEYVDHRAKFVPTCNDFTNNAHSDHFPFSVLRTGDYSWAIIRQGLLDGLELIYATDGNVAFTINSAYRNPGRNARLAGSARDSRHLYGDAADIATDEATWDRFKSAGRLADACVEPKSQSGFGHVHVDWRGKCPVGWY